MNTTPLWINIRFKREELHGKTVTFKDDSGREVTGRLEVENVNERGQMLVRVCYTPGEHSGTVMLTAFRLTQDQVDSLKQDGDRFILECES